jgi:hypothetical protein
LGGSVTEVGSKSVCGTTLLSICWIVCGSAVSQWDFLKAVKFWLDGKHANHGFFLHGDSNDYMLMHTPKAQDSKQRPVLMVIYEPKP